MVKSDNVPPAMWTLPEAHAMYLNKLDHLITPLQMVDITIDTLFDLSDDYEVPVSDIFTVVNPNEVIVLLQRRKLSPWLLLKSPKFVHFYTNSTSVDEQIILKTLIMLSSDTDRISTSSFAGLGYRDKIGDAI